MAEARVPFAGLDRQHAAIEGELSRTLDRVIGRSAFILGEEVEAFEAEFAEYVGVEHCVGVSSGTAALTIAMLAAGIGPGDEVIVPAMTFVASALAVIHTGATPVLCDVLDSDGLIDLESAATRVSERTVAIMPVHLYGQLCDMEAVTEFASARGIAVIEDAAQAHGAGPPGARAGSFGLAAGFSFYPSKNLGRARRRRGDLHRRPTAGRASPGVPRPGPRQGWRPPRARLQRETGRPPGRGASLEAE